MAGTSRSLLCESFGHHGYISRDQPYAEEARQGKLWDNLWDTNWKFPMHTDFSKTWQSQWYKSLVILYLFGIQQDAVEHDATRGWNSHFSLNPWPRPPSQAAKGGNALWWEALPLGVESIQCLWRGDIARAGAIQWPTWRQVMRWCFRVISWDVGRCWH